MRDLSFEIKGLLSEDVYFSVKDELLITENLDKEVDQAAAKFGFYALLSEKAETKYQKLKFRFESWKAAIESEEISRRFVEKVKPATESQMKAFVSSHKEYKLYKERLLQLEEQCRVQKILARAFEIKKDLIQTKCSNRRSELKAPKTMINERET